jgi:hypothetical protein
VDTHHLPRLKIARRLPEEAMLTTQHQHILLNPMSILSDWLAEGSCRTATLRYPTTRRVRGARGGVRGTWMPKNCCKLTVRRYKTCLHCFLGCEASTLPTTGNKKQRALGKRRRPLCIILAILGCHHMLFDRRDLLSS